MAQSIGVMGIHQYVECRFYTHGPGLVGDREGIKKRKPAAEIAPGLMKNGLRAIKRATESSQGISRFRFYFRLSVTLESVPVGIIDLDIGPCKNSSPVDLIHYTLI
jgi:hypothetical protein